MNKIIVGILCIILLVGVVCISGCTDAGTKEIKVKEINAKYDSFESSMEYVEIPENASSIRVVYDLDSVDTSGFDGNANLYTTDSDPKSGRDALMNGDFVDTEYLQDTGDGINGEIEFLPAKYFVYDGMLSGKITVYATVPV